MRAAAAHSQAQAAALLVKSWAGLPPSGRRATLEALLSQPERTLVLLDELEAGRIDADDLDAARRFQLLNHRRSDVREQAAESSKPGPRPSAKMYWRSIKLPCSLSVIPDGGGRCFKKRTAWPAITWVNWVSPSDRTSAICERKPPQRCW